MKTVRLISVLVLFVGAAFAGEGARAPQTTPTTSAILPQQFAGWQISGSGDDGRKLTIRAARFADASGAYGAFTYYKMPQMLKETIETQGASLNERVLFYRGSVLVDAVFEKLSAMSTAELRDLSDALPLPPGNARNLPVLPQYLPKLGYVKNTAKYVLGPVGLEKISSPLSAQLVDFSVGAEVALGTYQTEDGSATLMLISYPTPQIAAERLRQIDAARESNAQRQGTPAIQNAGAIFDKRTGPMVVLAAGTISQAEARALLSAVNYEADVTWNENTYTGRKNNLGNLLLNVFLLCAILIAFSAVAGLAFGGIRVLFTRILPERLLHREKELEFIALNLSEGQVGGSDSKVSPSIKAG